MRTHLSIATLLLLPTASWATPLTCNAFKTRLEQAIVSAGDKVARISDYKLGFEGDDKSRRYDWSGIVGLVDGTMNCGPADEFEDFYASTKRDGPGLGDRLARLVNLGAAANCALSRGPVQACERAARQVLSRALAQYEREVKRGESSPAGLQDYDLSKGVSGEFAAFPTNFTFSIGPGRGSKMDEARQSFTAKLQVSD